MAISAADVNKLRQMTGSGMMDCKKALTEAGGDFEAAIDILRKAGQKVAAKRADNETNEGVVLIAINADGTAFLRVKFVHVGGGPCRWPGLMAVAIRSAVHLGVMSGAVLRHRTVNDRERTNQPSSVRICTATYL